MSQKRAPNQDRDYAAFARIDGRHPFREEVPGGFVDYPARRLRGSEVVYFNFDLAREMGLLPREHDDRLTPSLRRAILDTFSLVIINEYDELHARRFPRRDRLPHLYMATRYLQLQHPDRAGRTSGDGRSVWNGTWSARGITWDLSSCGTGVTRLCPATADTGRFFKTGNHAASYGCGTATLEEGMAAALMSETFHHGGLPTERVLAVLRRSDGFGITVRAARNLLRPSHFLAPLKQGNLERLRGLAEMHIRRQQDNGLYPVVRGRAARYRLLADEVARTFGRAVATFEREYIFCWLDWDGDNILTDGGIIDYGSVRQFGLFHREYRFDDGPRWSTTITEQRRKAREVVQNFAQIRDFLITGSRSPLRSFSRDPVLTLFDDEFVVTRRNLLLRNLGFDEHAVGALLRQHSEVVDRFDRAHAYFERARAARGPHRVEDGLNWNAIFSTRDLLRELPERYLESNGPVPTEELFEIALSSYASRRDRRLTPHRRRMAASFQRAYLELVEAVALRTGRTGRTVLRGIARRAAARNRYDRITGDAVFYAARRLVRHHKQLRSDVFHDVIRRFISHQVRLPTGRKSGGMEVGRADAKRVFDHLLHLTAQCRHGL